MTRYELLDRIGVGGIAEIFRGKAVAAQGFEKPVAIKRILPHLSQDRRFVELLIAEAKVLSLLKHRNIVQIFDVGLGDDGQYFLVMEFVDGKDLGTVQRAREKARQSIPFDLVLHLGAEICEALEHAHGSRGPDGKAMSLVHRDVSPSNVLLSQAGEVKLTDFGIAKRAEHDLTHIGPVRGRFAYISPEQSRNEHLDPRSDVFSVGILMWELLCNRPLFSKLDDISALNAIRRGDIPRPTQIDPRLPPQIDAIVMAALARDKSHRHATAEAFGNQLRSLRYSLDITTGDPAAEFAKILGTMDNAAPVTPRRKPITAVPNEFESPEATVIRIRTAAEFSTRYNHASISAAKEVIDRFEEEETRLAALSPEQQRVLRRAATEDVASASISSAFDVSSNSAAFAWDPSSESEPEPAPGSELEMVSAAASASAVASAIPGDEMTDARTQPMARLNSGYRAPQPPSLGEPRAHTAAPFETLAPGAGVPAKHLTTRKVAGFAASTPTFVPSAWMLFVAAIILAVASFAITRALLS